MLKENSIKEMEKNQEKMFRIVDICKMLNTTRNIVIDLINKLKLESESDKIKIYNKDDFNKIKELMKFKKYFESLYSINDMHKICDISNGSMKNVVNELQLIGITYGEYTRYTEDDLKSVQEFIKTHGNLKTYFYEKTCMKLYGVKNVYQRKDINEKAVKNSHTQECIDKQNKTKEVHYKEEGGYAKHMSNVGKERWNSYNNEEKENQLNIMQKGVIDKFGVDNVSKLDWVKEKKKVTTMNSIGFDNPLKDIERMKRGMLAKYGVEHNSHDDELLNRRVTTYKKHFEEYKNEKQNHENGDNFQLKFGDKSAKSNHDGYKNYKNNKDLYIEPRFCDKGDLTKRQLYGEDYGRKFFFERTNKTCIERYGENYQEIFTIKKMETNRKNHGGLHNSQTKESQDKMKQTYFEKTGYYHPSQNPKTRRNHRTCYYYDNNEFDSSWELAYYIYLKDHNISFEYHTISVPYEWNGKTHYYKIDFKVDDELIEIKGDHLLKENVYTDDGRSEAKFKYMKEHNVKVLSLEEIKPYLKYIKDTYGKDYLKSFRKKDEDEK